MPRPKADLHPLTIRLTPSALKTLHEFCVALSQASGVAMVSLSQGVAVLIECVEEAGVLRTVKRSKGASPGDAFRAVLSGPVQCPRGATRKKAAKKAAKKPVPNRSRAA